MIKSRLSLLCDKGASSFPRCHSVLLPGSNKSNCARFHLINSNFFAEQSKIVQQAAGNTDSPWMLDHGEAFIGLLRIYAFFYVLGCLTDWLPDVNLPLISPSRYYCNKNNGRSCVDVTSVYTVIP